MKPIAIFASELPGETPGVNASATPGEHPAGEPQPEVSSAAVPVPSGATARPELEREAPPSRPHASVVTKVAKLLISRGPDPRLARLDQSQNGFLHYKVLMSLQTKPLGE